MKAEPTSLSGSGESFASYRASTQKSFKAEIQLLIDCCPSGHLTPLQHARLLTQDVMQAQDFALQTTPSLAHNQFSNWMHVNNLQLILLEKKIAEARNRFFEYTREQEQWQERMRKCLVNFKLNFQRYCESIRAATERAEEAAFKANLNKIQNNREEVDTVDVVD